MSIYAAMDCLLQLAYRRVELTVKPIFMTKNEAFQGKPQKLVK